MAKGTSNADTKPGGGSKPGTPGKGGSKSGRASGQGDTGAWPSTKTGIDSGKKRSNAKPK